MRARVLPALAALVLGAATALLVACGSDGRIPSSNASSLNSALNQISSDFRAGHCVAAQQAVTKAENALLKLPDSVDASLRQRLQSGIQNLAAKVPAQCEQTQTQTQQTTTAAPTTDTGTTDTGTTDTGTTDTGTTDTGTTPSTPTDTGTPSTGTTTGTDTGTGGTSVGGVTTP
jgi:hypothetical protein